jgi:hypothetical protein
VARARDTDGKQETAFNNSAAPNVNQGVGVLENGDGRAGTDRLHFALSAHNTAQLISVSNSTPTNKAQSKHTIAPHGIKPLSVWQSDRRHGKQPRC